ncbi:MAG TPA: alpha/beta fold hydrolase [Anaerolineaceae bacterium]|nr:alpha/beta fold hydrolase [Anaerolineaceae bacterium]
MNTQCKTKIYCILLLISLVMVLGGGLLAYLIQTVGGTVEVRDVRWMGTNGTMMSGLLYIPKGVTAENPAPGIVAIHGYINSRETQSGFAIEYARRGYVVLASDQTGHGYSDPPAFANGFGGPDALIFLRSLDIVDKDNIGISGHSMGGWASVAQAMVLPDGYKAMVLAGSSTGTYGVADGTAEFPRNLGLVFSRYDEFSMLMWGSPVAADIVNTDKLKTLFGTTETVQVEKLYGSIEAGTARMLYMPNNNHPGDHILTKPIGMAVDWFSRTLEGGKDIPVNNQIWYWKEIGTLIALLGMVLFLFPMGGLLLQTRYFGVLAEEMPERKSATGIGWWIATILGIAIPPLTYFKAMHVTDAPFSASALLPQNITTGVVTWALVNTGIFLVLFTIWHFAFNKKAGGTCESYGVAWKGKPDWAKIGKSFLLAFAVVFGAYILLALSDFLFKTDFRFYVMAVKLLSPLQARIALVYAIPLLAFFLMSGVLLNGQLRLARKDGRDVSLGTAMLVNVAQMILGFIILLVVQYIPLYAGGTLANAAEPLFTIVAYQYLPLLTIAALVSTFFFRKTGRVYVGAFLNAMLIAWIIVAGTAIHFPF